MTNDPALDAAVRQARHLLFAFDGPIRSTQADDPSDPNAPTAPHIYEALVACYESGRSVVVISAKPQVDVPAYLDRHDLFTLITLIAASVSDAITSLEITPADCLVITSSPADIRAAHVAGVPSIGYIRTSDDATHLAEVRPTMFIYSMTDLALSLRALRLGP